MQQQRIRGVVAGRLKLSATVPEDDLQAAVVHMLEVLVLPPAEWAAYPAGHIALNGQQKAKLYRAGLKMSWPDLMIGHRGLLGIELKRVGEQLSISRWINARDRRGNIVKRWVEGQRETFPRLVASGAFQKIVVCRSVDEVLAELRAFGVPLRRT